MIRKLNIIKLNPLKSFKSFEMRTVEAEEVGCYLCVLLPGPMPAQQEVLMKRCIYTVCLIGCECDLSGIREDWCSDVCVENPASLGGLGGLGALGMT